MMDISSFEGNESDVFESVNESLTSIFRRAKFPPIDRFHASIIFPLERRLHFSPYLSTFLPVLYLFRESYQTETTSLPVWQPPSTGRRWHFFENTARIYRIYHVAGISADFLIGEIKA